MCHAVIPGIKGDLPDPTPEACWSAAVKSSNSVCLSGRIRYKQAHSKDALFELQLSPLNVQAGSKRFFQKFGSHRFLSISCPSIHRLPADLRDQYYNLSKRIQEWLNIPNKKFMGCKWTAMFARVIKDRRKSKQESNAEYYGGHEIFFFATDGPGLRSLTVDEVITWFIPLELNRSLTVCKAFARLELGTIVRFRQRLRRRRRLMLCRLL